MRTFKIEENYRKELEEFFAFVWQSTQKNNAFFSEKSRSTLPYKLSQELSYVYSKHLLYSMFSSFNSENFLREISGFLTVAHFMPGDYIVFKVIIYIYKLHIGCHWGGDVFHCKRAGGNCGRRQNYPDNNFREGKLFWGNIDPNRGRKKDVLRSGR